MKMKKLAFLLVFSLFASVAQPTLAINLGSSHDGKTYTIEIGQTQTYTFNSEDFLTSSSSGAIRTNLVANPTDACSLSVAQNQKPFQDRWTVSVRGLNKGTCTVGITDAFSLAKKKNVSFVLNVVAAKNPISVAFGVPSVTSRPFLRLMTGGEITVRALHTTNVVATPITSDICAVTNPGGTHYTYGATFSLKAFALGNCQIRFDSAENSKWAASSFIATIPVQKATQAISYSALPFWYVPYGPTPLAIKSSSGLPVQVVAGPSSVCTWTNQILTPVGAGNCLLSMNQAGDSTYLGVSESWRFAIRKVDKKITVGTPLRDMVIGTTQVLNITGSKSLRVSTTTPLVCSLSGLVITALKTGSCAITASDPADSGFNEAPAFYGLFAVTLAPSKISYRGPTELQVDSKPIAATFSSTSTAPITVGVADQSICTYSNSSVVALRPGVCVLTATQGSTENFGPATPLKISIAVSKTRNALVATPPTRPVTLGASLTVNLLTLSGALATLTSTSPSTCAVTGSQITPLTSGICRLTFSAPEDSRYLALSSTISLEMVKASQTISASSALSLLSLSKSKTTAVTTSSSSGLPVSVTTSSHCSFSNGTLTAVRVTTSTSLCLVTITQLGDQRFNPAPAVTLRIRITN